MIIKKKNIILFMFFTTGIVTHSFSQNMIGYNVNDIKKTVKRIHPTYKMDESAIKSPNSSIKFTDKDKERTLMYFLSKEGICTSCKFIIDNNHMKTTVDSLSTKYKKKETLIWLDKSRSQHCEIQLIEGEWFFTVMITPQKK